MGKEEWTEDISAKVEMTIAMKNEELMSRPALHNSSSDKEKT